MENMEAALATVIDSKKIKTSLIDRYAFASDAGFYYLLPKAIVQPSTTEEIKQLFAFAHEKKYSHHIQNRRHEFKRAINY